MSGLQSGFAAVPPALWLRKQRELQQMRRQQKLLGESEGSRFGPLPQMNQQMTRGQIRDIAKAQAEAGGDPRLNQDPSSPPRMAEAPQQPAPLSPEQQLQEGIANPSQPSPMVGIGQGYMQPSQPSFPLPPQMGPQRGGFGVGAGPAANYLGMGNEQSQQSFGESPQFAGQAEIDIEGEVNQERRRQILALHARIKAQAEAGIEQGGFNGAGITRGGQPITQDMVQGGGEGGRFRSPTDPKWDQRKALSKRNIQAYKDSLSAPKRNQAAIDAGFQKYGGSPGRGLSRFGNRRLRRNALRERAGRNKLVQTASKELDAMNEKQAKMQAVLRKANNGGGYNKERREEMAAITGRRPQTVAGGTRTNKAALEVRKRAKARQVAKQKAARDVIAKRKAAAKKANSRPTGNRAASVRARQSALLRQRIMQQQRYRQIMAQRRARQRTPWNV